MPKHCGSSLISSLSIADLMMVLLTAIIAISVFWQANSTRDMTRMYRDQHELDVDRSEPKVRIGLHLFSFWRDTGQKHFHGFTITNANHFEITITYIELELGVPVNHKGSYTAYLGVLPKRGYQGTPLSDFSLPHRLKYGESIKVLYDSEELFERQHSTINEQNPARYRFRCMDSLGNTYHHDSWMVHESDGPRSFPDPGSGIIAVSERNKRKLGDKIS